ncbi:hypothetical protein [Alitabrizicola rongguiensis]|uniref:hypothetical protein n=1 Tax=Alitabrizicola rongguiensis TaxID=2909234 RepID=UPI001F1833C6|nr:hypothetical protein [Tabrizicola rongguiensis]
MFLLPLGLIAVFLALWLMRRNSSLTRGCLWRLDRTVAPNHWRCAACGAEIDLPPGKAPRDCLKPSAED